MSLGRPPAPKTSEYRLETQTQFKINLAAPKTTVVVNYTWHKGTCHRYGEIRLANEKGLVFWFRWMCLPQLWIKTLTAPMRLSRWSVVVRGICSVHRFNRHLALASPSYTVSPQKITEHMWKQELAMNLCQPVTSCQSIIYSEICWAKSGPQSRVQTQDSRGIKTCDKRSRAVMHLAL